MRKLLWYSPPKQRQRWGETQILPSDNWGQIFFDLFYVGGAYNLGNVIKSSDLDLKCLLYFCALGFPCMMMWHDKLFFDARFTTRPGFDVVHRFIEVAQLCCVATALSRIRTVDVLSHPSEHVDVFQLSSALFLNSIFTLFRYIEVILIGIGDPGAAVTARKDIICRIIPALFLLAAALDSGLLYFGSKSGYENVEIANERPVCFCFASWLSWAVIGYCDRVFCAPRQQRIETSVPLNVHFCMHRYGEWFMLMFGESVMSLVIVEGDNESVYHSTKFYSGVLSVICLAHLHFQSEPNHNEDHALTRSRHSNYIYTLLVPFYSLALIAVGVCYKMFLYDYQSYDAGESKNGYRALGDGDGNNDSYDDSGSISYGYGDVDYGEKKQQFTADVFSISLATVLLCQDLLVWLHQGSHAIVSQCRKIPILWLTLLVLSKYALLFFLAVMSAFENDPHFVAFFGMGAIIFQEILRRLFHASQRTPLITNCEKPIKDDDTACSDTTKGTNVSFYTLDDDYERDIQSFADAKSALAKFEQLMLVGEAQDLSGTCSNKINDNEDAPPYHQWRAEI